nr:reverse transcriptase domain-containing protein [Tanacetum cinerariifolium]
SSLKLSHDQTSNSTSSMNPTPKGRIRRSSKQKVKNSNFEENPLPPVPIAENQTMAQLLQAPTDGYEDAIVIPEIAATNFELKHEETYTDPDHAEYTIKVPPPPPVQKPKPPIQRNFVLRTRDSLLPHISDVFVPVGKVTFSVDFVVVDYEGNPRVPIILGRPFLTTARALIDVHCEEMVLRDRDERFS